MKKVVVAGGAGFLGSHLCKKLLEEAQVICIDNLSTGSRENIASLFSHPHFVFLEHDVTHPLAIKAVDEIYNLACPASPVHYQADPLKTGLTSVLGSLHLLELARRFQAKIFQASTSEVYGDPEQHPQTEEYWGRVNPIGLRSCYDEGKRFAETLFFDFWRTYDFPIKVGRIFNTYGPHMHPQDGRVVSNFIVQALKGDPLTLYGQGAQTRSFCYVDDLIEAILRFMQTEESVTGPINLGNDQEFSIKELAEQILEITGSSSQMIYKPLPADDPQQRRPDLTLARKVLNWQPSISLREGLERTVAYFQKQKMVV